MIFLLIFSSAEAATLRLNQTKIRLIIPPGTTKTGTIEVENPSAEEVSVKAYLEDWRYSSTQDGTKEFFPPNSTPLSCANWLTFSPSEFNLPPFGKKAVRYTINVPKNTEGGHYAVLFFETLLGKPDLKEGVGLNIIVRVGTLFYVEPEGTIRRKADIENFSVETEKDKLKISLDLKNSGNVDLTARGTFHIIDQQGRIYARGEFNEVYIFPQDTARMIALWQENIPEGKYDLVITLDLGKALQELNIGSGPVIAKEVDIEIDAKGRVSRVGALK
ncbi:MAG: hypothetical protein NC909_01005 [Candidatus Omnitrophica bacterium]|nr:hypothetical protein [Candidatus Omnitrophota bacterium]